jgi:hypothetical protein
VSSNANRDAGAVRDDGAISAAADAQHYVLGRLEERLGREAANELLMRLQQHLKL